MYPFLKKFFRSRAGTQDHSTDVVFEAAGKALASRDLREAARLYERVIQLNPSRSDAYYKLGNVQRDLGALRQAVGSFDAAVLRNPKLSHAYCNRGVVLHQLGQLDDALQSLDKAIALEPGDTVSHYNKALVLQDRARWEEALGSYTRAIELDPSFSDAQYNRALLLLTLGDYLRGWRAYEWRWKVADRVLIGQQRVYGQPLWSGEQPIANKRLLLYCEGGLGDTLQFSRYVALCADRGARVILQVQPPLTALLGSAPGVSEILTLGDPLPPFDLHCPLMSLPLAFGTTQETVPSAAGYLSTDPLRSQAWLDRLGRKSRPRVGLVWSGNPNNWIDRTRSISLLEWLPTLPLQYEYFCLQTDIRATDAAVLAGSPIRRFNAAELDFVNTAALCKHLDLILTVDTSLAHLAGALGCPVWLLLPTPADWRWGLERADTPWYSNTRLYRRAASQTWQELFERLSHELRAHFQDEPN